MVMNKGKFGLVYLV